MTTSSTKWHIEKVKYSSNPNLINSKILPGVTVMFACNNLLLCNRLNL